MPPRSKLDITNLAGAPVAYLFNSPHSRWVLRHHHRLRGFVPPHSSSLRYVDHGAGTGVELFQAVCSRDLEGIVAKLARGHYTPEETTWVKIKNARYSQAEGRGFLRSLARVKQGRVRLGQLIAQKRFAKNLLRNGPGGAGRTTSPCCVVPLEQFNLAAVEPSLGVLQLFDFCPEPCHPLVMPSQGLSDAGPALAMYFDLDVCNGHGCYFRKDAVGEAIAE